ncbi:hypothetical protein BCR44DRAFT_1514023 [Catenaria anguillulae PL171]|uniref:Uncharacterized protein n=1 Tax=Catenaria anguillulae PL171 TaxID=765915 RepID=A0A1Y2HKX7_9FUNG|nr:hypothetical protein BCR44DRAFT_1514023 [Catenaria anguillulae PL171]
MRLQLFAAHTSRTALATGSTGMHRNLASSHTSRPSQRSSDAATSPPAVQHLGGRPDARLGDSVFNAAHSTSSADPQILALATAARSYSHIPTFSRQPLLYHLPPSSSVPQSQFHQQQPQRSQGAAHAQPVGRHSWPLHPNAQHPSSLGTSSSPPTTDTSQSSNPIPTGIPLHHHDVPQQQDHRMPPPSEVQRPLRRLSDADQSDPHMLPEATGTAHHDRRVLASHFASSEAYAPEVKWGDQGNGSARERDPYVFHQQQQQQQAYLQDRRRKRGRGEPHSTSRLGSNGPLTLSESVARLGLGELHASARTLRRQGHMEQQQLQSFRLQRAGLIPSPALVRQSQTQLQASGPSHPALPSPQLLPVSPDAANIMATLNINSPPSAQGISTSPSAAQYADLDPVVTQSTSPKSISTDQARRESIHQQARAGADEQVACKFPQYLAISPGTDSPSSAKSASNQQMRDQLVSLPSTQRPLAAGPNKHDSFPRQTWLRPPTDRAVLDAQFQATDSEPRMKRPRSTPEMGALDHHARHTRQQQSRDSAVSGVSHLLRSRSSMSNLPRPAPASSAIATGSTASGSGTIPARKSIRELISSLMSSLNKVKPKEPASVLPPSMHLSIGPSTSVSPLVSPALSAADGTGDASRHQAPLTTVAPGPRPIAAHIPAAGCVNAGTKTPMRQRELVVGNMTLSANQLAQELEHRDQEANAAERAWCASHDVHAAAAVLAADMNARSGPSTSSTAGNATVATLVASTPSSVLLQVPAVAPPVTEPLVRPAFVATDDQVQALAQGQQPVTGPIPSLPTQVPYGQHHQLQQQAQSPAPTNTDSINNLFGTYSTNPGLSSVDMPAEMQGRLSGPALLDAFLSGPDAGAQVLVDPTDLSRLLRIQQCIRSGGVVSDAAVPLVVSPDVSKAWPHSPFAQAEPAPNGHSTDQGHGSVVGLSHERQANRLDLGDRAGQDVLRQAVKTVTGWPVGSEMEVSGPAVVVAPNNWQQHKEQQPVFQQHSSVQLLNGPAQIFINPDPGLYSPTSTNPLPNNSQIGHYPPLPPGFVPMPVPGVALVPMNSAGMGLTVLNPLALPLPSPSDTSFSSPISPNSHSWSACQALPHGILQAQDASACDAAPVAPFANTSSPYSRANPEHTGPNASGH